MKELSGKSAIVTASSRGIGRAIAIKLASNGAAVVVNWNKDEAAARSVVDAIQTNGGTAIAVGADVSERPDVENLFAEAASSFGGVDILVNNAGIYVAGPIAAIDEKVFDRALAVNLKGTFFAMQAAARAMNSGGRIINISSGNTRTGLPNVGVYAATKAAVEQLGYALAKELGPRQITVNSVLPGVTETDSLSDAVVAQFAAIIARTPLGRIGRPDDIAEVVAFLAGPGGSWVNGQSIAAAGGLI